MKAEHVIMGGPSGAGKTTELRRMHEEFDGVSVWVNHTSGPVESFASGVAGYRAEGREAMQTAVGKFDEWEEVRVNLKINNINEGLATAAQFAVDVNDTTTSNGNPVAVQVICDESHHADDDLFNWYLAEGRDHALKFATATQNPRKWPKDDLINARYWVWVGPYASANKGWLDYYGFPRDDMAQKDFTYEVFNRSMERLYKGQTVEEYA